MMSKTLNLIYRWIMILMVMRFLWWKRRRTHRVRRNLEAHGFDVSHLSDAEMEAAVFRFALIARNASLTSAQTREKIEQVFGIARSQ